MRRRLPIWFVTAFLVGMGVVWLFPASRYRLIGLLRNESSFQGRPTSYWANALKKGPTSDGKLLRQGGAAAVPVLAELAQYEDDEVRVEALLALAVLGAEAKGAAPVLLELLSSERSPPVLDLAKQILLQVDRQAAMLGCLELLKKSTTIHSRSCALDGLERIGPEDAGAVEPLTKALDDDNLLVRAVAARALWRIHRKAEPILPALIVCLRSHDKEVSVYAGETLSLIGREGKAAVPSLMAALSDEDAGVRSRAAWALFHVGAGREAVPALIAALQDESADVRSAATVPLGWIGAIEAVPALLQALKDDNFLVRCRAASALGLIRPQDGKTVPAMVEALSDKQIRSNVARALGDMGDRAEAAVPALTEALKDADVWVRLFAASSLWRIEHKSTSALPVLLQALKDKNQNIRTIASAALSDISQKDSDPNVRRAAAKALEQTEAQSKTRLTRSR